jgi:hypothetical protein
MSTPSLFIVLKAALIHNLDFEGIEETNLTLKILQVDPINDFRHIGVEFSSAGERAQLLEVIINGIP